MANLNFIHCGTAFNSFSITEIQFVCLSRFSVTQFLLHFHSVVFFFRFPDGSMSFSVFFFRIYLFIYLIDFSLYLPHSSRLVRKLTLCSADICRDSLAHQTVNSKLRCQLIIKCARSWTCAMRTHSHRKTQTCIYVPVYSTSV